MAVTAQSANQLNYRPKYRGLWDAATRYNPGDVVLDNGGLYYLCITANTNEDASASTTGNWQQFNPLSRPIAVNVAAVTPATDGTTAGTAVNAVITSLINAGIMAAP